MKSEKGQSLVGFVGIVGVIALILVCLIGVPKETPTTVSIGKVGDIAQELPQDVSDMVRQFTANEHALTGHPEAEQVQDCLRNKGPERLWRDRTTKDWYALCQLPDGKWGMMVCTADGQFSKTAYVPKDGTWQELLKYLGKRGTPTKMAMPGGCD